MNVAEEKDELGRPINRLEEEVDNLNSTSQAPQAAPVAPEPTALSYTKSDDFMSTLRSGQEPSGEPQVDDFMSTLRSGQEPSGEPQVDDFMSTLKGAQTQDQTGGYASTGPGIQFSGFAAADEVLQSFEAGSLTKDVALDDPRVMALMRTGLEFRFGDRGTLRKAAGAVASGISTNYKENMDDEEVYEMWQNWQRSFHGGQTSTLASETVFIAGLDEEEKAFAGAQYLLFDKSPNIFSKDVGWLETADGIWDYTRAAVWDSTTLMSAGVGRAFSIGGAKAASSAIRLSATASFKAALKSGATREAARQVANQTARRSFVAITAKEVAKYSAVDFVANVTGDVLYQNLMMDVGAQEEYSAAQTGVAALATMAIPAIMAGSSGFSAFARSDVAPDFLKPAVDVSEKFRGVSKEVIDRQMRLRINWDMVDEQFGDTIENFSNNRGLYTKWSDALLDSKDMIGGGINLTDTEKVFVRGFMFGPTDGSQKGFVQTMEEAGLVHIQRSADDNITNFIGDAISWLPDEQVTKYIKAFTDTFEDFSITGNEALGLKATKLSQIETAEEFAAFWRVRQSEVGSRLWDSSEVKRRLGRSGRATGPAGEGEATATDLIDAMLAKPSEKIPEKQVGAYIGSMWKSTLTATPATTGANLRGWGVYTGLNNISDLVSGALNLGVGGIQRAVGATDAAKVTIQTGKASILGSMRRGVGFVGMSDTLESASGLLEKLDPRVMQALSRDMGGDSGAAAGRETLELFGLNPNSKILKATEATRNFLQTISGIKLQDEITKKLNFMTHVEQYTRQFYGKSYNDFMDDPLLGFIEMQSPKFHDTVIKNSLDRALRETGSLAWSGKQGSNFALQAARGVEAISRNKVGGYIVPFGKFFNTATAMVGDYSGMNMLRYSVNAFSRDPSRLASEEFTTLASKAIVGWTGVALLSQDKLDNIENGRSFEMVQREDGSIRDVSMDFPEAIMHATAQALAHYNRDGRVPDDLKTKIGDLLLGNTTRSGANTFKLINDTLSGERPPRALIASFTDSAIKTAAGFTRPLDPLNSMIKLVEQDFDEPDRNTSGDRWTDYSMVKKATRYTDQFFELVGLGPEETPKASMGITTYGSSNMEPALTLGARRAGGLPLSRKMLNAVGRADWSTFNWGGDKELKSWMNLRMEAIFEANAAVLYEKNPDFFDQSLREQEILVRALVTNSRDMLNDVFDNFGGEEMKYRRRLDKVNKAALSDVMRDLDIKGDLLDLLEKEEGLALINTVLLLAESQANIYGEE